jgi:hypothetical protein
MNSSMDNTLNSGQSIFSCGVCVFHGICDKKKARLFHIFPAVFDHLRISPFDPDRRNSITFEI